MRQRLRRFVEVLFGEGGATGADPSDLFDVSTGWVTLASHGYDHAGTAGLCFSDVSSVDFDAVVRDVEELLAVSAEETNVVWDVIEDDYGYHWVLLSEATFEALVSDVHMVSDTLVEEGYESALLCAVFAFEQPGPDDSGDDPSGVRSSNVDTTGDHEVYWIYNFSRGSWYPFAPRGVGDRDGRVEEELRETVGNELDLEADPDREYPLWGIPF